MIDPRSALLVYLFIGTMALLSALLGWFGGYLGSYAKRKGENLATREDISELTRLTKEIEAKISDEVWNRQRRWETRRDAVFDALKDLAALRYSLRLVIATHDKFGLDPSENTKIQAQREYLEKHFEALTSFARAKILAMVACGKEVRDQFDIVETLIDVATKKAIAGQLESYDKLHEAWAETEKLVGMIRRELEIDSVADTMPRSSGSS